MSFVFDVEADLAQIQRMQQVMKNQDQFRAAAQKAINRGLASAKTQGNKEVRARYDISLSNLNKYSQVRLNKASISGNEIVGEIMFGGQKIPLYRFSVKPKTRTYTMRYVNGHSGWRITSAVSAGDIKGSMLARPPAFIATMSSGHTGIFRRADTKTKSGKSKLIEYWGMSIADMIDYVDARDAVIQKASETVQKRLDHEIQAVLNGGY